MMHVDWQCTLAWGLVACLAGCAATGVQTPPGRRMSNLTVENMTPWPCQVSVVSARAAPSVPAAIAGPLESQQFQLEPQQNLRFDLLAGRYEVVRRFHGIGTESEDRQVIDCVAGEEFVWQLMDIQTLQRLQKEGKTKVTRNTSGK